MKLRSLFYAVLFALAPVSAAMPQAVNRSALTTQNNTNITTNNAAQITGAKLNAMIASIIASAGTLLDAQTWSSLQTFTVSPVAPTPTVSDKSTTLATTAFVANNIAPHFLAYPGAVCDGTTDTSTAAQAFIDANKGKRIVFDAGISCYMRGIILNGTSYNNTVIDFQGELLLAPPTPLPSSSNFQGAAWVGIALQGCSGCRVEGNFNGNRSNMPQSEFIFTVVYAGVTTSHTSRMDFKEVRGDGLLIGQNLITSSSANSDGLIFDSITCANSSVDGRNCISHISGDNVTIGTIHSINVGGIVNGAREPGGYALEVDYAFQTAKNVTIGEAYISSAGNSGFEINGVSGSGNVKNVNVGTLRVVNTAAPFIIDGAGHTTYTSDQPLIIKSASNVVIGNYSGEFTNAYGNGIVISNSDKVDIKGKIKHVRVGGTYGYLTSNTDIGIANSNININVDDVVGNGFAVYAATNVVFSGIVTNPQTGFGAQQFGVYTQKAIPFTTNQINVTYKVNVPFNSNWLRAYREEPAQPIDAYTNTNIVGADFGLGWGNYIYMKEIAIPCINCTGYNINPPYVGAPNTGPHSVGEILYQTPAVGFTAAYVCVTAGVPGTWVGIESLARGKNIAVPVNNGVVTLTSAAPFQIINPAGTLGGITVTFPASPVDAQPQSVAFEQAITTLTFSGGTVVGAPSTATAGQGLSFIYDAGTAKWYRTQ